MKPKLPVFIIILFCKLHERFVLQIISKSLFISFSFNSVAYLHLWIMLHEAGWLHMAPSSNLWRPESDKNSMNVRQRLVSTASDEMTLAFLARVSQIKKHYGSTYRFLFSSSVKRLCSSCTVQLPALWRGSTRQHCLSNSFLMNQFKSVNTFIEKGLVNLFQSLIFFRITADHELDFAAEHQS